MPRQHPNVKAWEREAGREQRSPPANSAFFKQNVNVGISQAQGLKVNLKNSSKNHSPVSLYAAISVLSGKNVWECARQRVNMQITSFPGHLVCRRFIRADVLWALQIASVRAVYGGGKHVVELSMRTAFFWDLLSWLYFLKTFAFWNQGIGVIGDSRGHAIPSPVHAIFAPPASRFHRVKIRMERCSHCTRLYNILCLFHSLLLTRYWLRPCYVLGTVQILGLGGEQKCHCFCPWKFYSLMGETHSNEINHRQIQLHLWQGLHIALRVYNRQIWAGQRGSRRFPPGNKGLAMIWKMSKT